MEIILLKIFLMILFLQIFNYEIYKFHNLSENDKPIRLDMKFCR